MSISVMTAIWKNSPHKGEALILLLALADWANDEGECWPSMPVLAKKGRVTEQAARRIVKRLESDGSLEIVRGGGSGNTNHYILKPQPKVPLVDGQTPTLATKKGEPSTLPYKEEPSLEPSSISAAQVEPFTLTPQVNGNGTHKADPRFKIFMAYLKQYWDEANEHKIEFPNPGQAGGAQLNALLKKSPDLTAEQFLDIVNNRLESAGVNHAEEVHRWLPKCLNYLHGPLDAYGKPRSS